MQKQEVDIVPLDINQEELTQGWIISLLPEYVYFQEGPGLRKWQFGEDGVPFLNIRTFNKGIIDKTKCQFVKQEEFDGKYEHFLLNEGDIVVSSSGTIGKVAIIRENDLPLMLNTSVIRFRSLYPDNLLQEYLKYYLQSRHFFSQLGASITGSAISNYGPSHLKQMRILVPPVNEQRRIVAKLEKLLAKVDTCKERLDKIPAILKRFRQSILAAACSGRLTADWREINPEVEPASQLLQRIQEERYIKYQGRYREAVLPPHNPLPEMPQKWCSATLDQLSFFVTSGSRGWAQYYSDTGAIFIRAQDINTDQLKITEVAHVNLPEDAEGTRSRVKFGDLLITATGANVAKTALVDVELPEAYVSQHIGLVRLVNIECCQFIHYWIISSLHGRAQLLDAAYGAGKPGLNLDNIRELIIALPSLPEQQEIVQRIKTLFKIADQIEQRYQKARGYVDKLTQSILAKAFRGELVPQDPNDEPASVLLERIRAERAKREAEAKAAKKSTGKKGGRRGRKAKQQDSEPIQLELPLLE